MASIRQAFTDLGCDFFVSYGMTECCGKISISLVKEDVRAMGFDAQVDYCCTSGRPFICTDVRIVDDEGFDLPQGDSGEIVIRGDALFHGYWPNPNPNWKDMILVGGENVYSAEVERVLGSAPEVAMAAVVGVPDPTPGGIRFEIVMAFIVCKAGFKPENPQEEKIFTRKLQKFAGSKLASYKIPVVVEYRSKLPMNLES